MTHKQKNSPWKKTTFLIGLIFFAALTFSLLLPVRAAVGITVPYSTTPVAESDLDGYPNTGTWSDALSTTIPLENGAAAPYGTATLYVKHDGKNVYYRIDGSIDTSWVSAAGNHFWLGMQASQTGTSHHGGGGGWDGVFFGLWDGTDYTPEPTYPPTPVDTNGFGKPPTKDNSQNALGAMRYSGSAAPFGFTAEWKKALNTGDTSDIALVADGTTTYNFFVTTDSDGGGSSGGNIDHSKITNLNTMKLAPSAPPVVRDVAITGVTASPTTVTVGDTVTVTVNAANQGTQSETFDVTAYYDSTTIGTQTITLATGGSTTLTFSWITTGVTPSTYTIRATASVVTGETDTADNTYIDGTVTVNPPVVVVHDVAITAVYAAPTTVTVGQPVTVTVDAQNQGTASETFTVTASFDSNVIGTQTVTLSADATTTLSFTWDTAGVTAGTYTISAVASTVPDETDTVDNTYTDGTVTVQAPVAVVAASLTGRSAWPDYKHLDLSKASIQTLYAKITNTGTSAVYVYAEFQIRDAETGNLVTTVSTTEALLPASGDTTTLSTTWTAIAGKYSVTAVLYYRATDAVTWQQASKTKTFSFNVVNSIASLMFNPEFILL